MSIKNIKKFIPMIEEDKVRNVTKNLYYKWVDENTSLMAKNINLACFIIYAFLIPFDYIFFGGNDGLKYSFVRIMSIIFFIANILIVYNAERSGYNEKKYTIKYINFSLYAPLCLILLSYAFFLGSAPKKYYHIIFTGSLMATFFSAFILNKFWKYEIILFFFNIFSIFLVGSYLKIIFIDEILLIVCHIISFVFAYFIRREFSKNLYDKYVNMLSLENAQMKIIQNSQFAELGKTYAVIAHEIYSPLSGVVWLNSFIKSTLKAGNLTEEKIRHLIESTQKSDESINHIKLIIENIKNAAGNQHAPSGMELINDVVNIAVGMSGYSFKGAANMSVDIAPNLKAWMQKVTAVRCIVNLITNAVYVMEKAKTKNAQIKIWAETKNNQVQLIVQDNGPGISEEVQKNIFKSNFTTKPVGEGNGLGLMMVRNMMEEIDGTVGYRTSEKGTEFILSFPDKDPSQ